MTPLSPLPSSVSMYPVASDADLECELEAREPSSLWLFVRDGFVLGDEAGDAIIGEGRGCWCIVSACPRPGAFVESEKIVVFFRRWQRYRQTSLSLQEARPECVWYLTAAMGGGLDVG